MDPSPFCNRCPPLTDEAWPPPGAPTADAPGSGAWGRRWPPPREWRRPSGPPPWSCSWRSPRAPGSRCGHSAWVVWEGRVRRQAWFGLKSPAKGSFALRNAGFDEYCAPVYQQQFGGMMEDIWLNAITQWREVDTCQMCNHIPISKWGGEETKKRYKKRSTKCTKKNTSK